MRGEAGLSEDALLEEQPLQTLSWAKAIPMVDPRDIESCEELLEAYFMQVRAHMRQSACLSMYLYVCPLVCACMCNLTCLQQCHVYPRDHGVVSICCCTDELQCPGTQADVSSKHAAC